MAKPRAKRLRKPPLYWRILRSLYIVVFAFSLVIVVGYAALHILAPAPTVDKEVILPNRENLNASGDTLQASSSPKQTILTRRDGVYTCLLIGHADMGGTDTLMLGVFDTGARTASLISIPRDTPVRTNGRTVKINSVYSQGKAELLANTVSTMLGVPVDFYLEVDTKAFKAIVDEIGGVLFDVPPGMDYEDPYQNLYIHISPGFQRLNGDNAVKVMRCRSAYASQDIGRVQTQRKFLTALVDQTITLSNVPRVTNLINILSQYVVTDMRLSDMIHFATQAIGMELETDLSSYTLPGKWISPYYELDDQQVLELVNNLGVYEGEVPMAALHILHP